MAYQEALKKLSFDADSSIASYTGPPGLPGSASPNYGKIYCFVKLVSSKTVGLCTNASNEDALGVLQSKPQKVGTAAAVALIDGGGVSKIMCGSGGLAVGDRVRSDGAGRGVTAASGERAYATCVEAGASGALASIALNRSGTLAN